ncbi:hypothetical protein PVW46_11090 [Mameliella sp. AT18]|uniref:hypothetical protein n=1 Tax=Mameliella sp. AT18 TaxID=3028385 RepID=UPI00237ADE05|nr:hypothetical protein [Mameliella sp. AT18]MDD9730453.1 hypothetical protein [Mameliella sp. AT18]
MTLSIAPMHSDPFRTGGLCIALKQERNLWAAVLLQAIDDAVRGVKASDGNFDTRVFMVEQARAYFTRRNEDLDEICIFLGLNPDAVRSHVIRQISEAPDAEELTRNPKRRKSYVRRSGRRKPTVSNVDTMPGGVVSDFARSQGTGGGTTAQDRSEIGFSGKAA